MGSAQGLPAACWLCPSLVRGGAVQPGCPRARRVTAFLKSCWHPVATQLQTSLVGAAVLGSLCWGRKELAAGRSSGCSSIAVRAANRVPGAPKGWDPLLTAGLPCRRSPHVSAPLPTSPFPSAHVTSGGQSY